ncbi:MAG TPA: hypothetical protein VML55_15900 [Planctomycetaceae bacterium]|nr:hypothetical protein [Planctomycetaceae bacterium]
MIAAVRAARHRISEAVGHDPRKLVEYYRERQSRRREPNVTRGKSETATEAQDEAAA